MHTAHQLHAYMFEIAIDGRPADPPALLDWGAYDRLGVVIDRPLGAIGASLMIQLAITAFFDVPGRMRRERPLYAEIYLFHAGGRFGNFSSFDFWPARREVFLGGDGAEMLRAINSHGITHLLVPDGPVETIEHHHKEPEAALDRLKRCFAYAPAGRVEGADIAIRALDPALLANIDSTIDAASRLARAETQPQPEQPAHRRDRAHWLGNLRARLGEVSPAERAAAAAGRQAISAAGLPTETYRTISVATALGRLDGRADGAAATASRGITPAGHGR